MKNKRKIILPLITLVSIFSISVTSCNVFSPKEEKTYTVKWAVENEKVLEIDENVKEGEIPTYDGETPIKKDDSYYSYEFKGWDKELKPVTGDIVYYAIFDATDKYYTVIWTDEEGNVLEVDKVKAGEKPEYNSETPTKDTDEYMYTFKGRDKPLSPIINDTTFKPEFYKEINNETYTVKYVNYDGSLIKEYKDVGYGEYSLYFGTLPTRRSDLEFRYNFIGWSPNIGKIEKDTEYIAQYEAIPLNEYRPFNEDNYISNLPTKEKGQFFLFGETHDDYYILQEELKRWDIYYNEYDMRDFYIERNSIFASQLNMYVSGKNDKILDDLFQRGGLGSTGPDFNYEFYKTFKEKYPETRFHGIDSTSGGILDDNYEFYVDHLIANNEIEPSVRDVAIEDLKNSAEYRVLRTQGKEGDFRETKMTQRFIENFENSGRANCAGSFGIDHILKYRIFSNNTPSMGNRLYHLYGENIYSESLENTIYGPSKVIDLKIGSKYYQVFDHYDRKLSKYSGLGDYDTWHPYVIVYPEDTYDFINCSRTGEKIDRTRIALSIDYEHQTYIIDFKKDGKITRKYYQANNSIENYAYEFIID